jgi:hypothetical protein
MNLVRGLLHREGAIIFAGATWAYFALLGASWIVYLALIVAPDVSAVGYLRGPRLGAWTYNLVHTEALPVREVGMMHCYAGDLDLARRYLDLGFLISVPGPVTYANNTRGRGVAAEVPLDRLLVETEAAAHRARVVRALRQHEAPRQALTSRIGRRQDDVLPLGGRSDGRTRRRTRPPSRAWRDGPVTSSTTLRP